MIYWGIRPFFVHYQVCWRDRLRHVANFSFIMTYICFERGWLVTGALCTLVGESLLIPSAIKHKSWSSWIVAGVFIVMSLNTLAHNLL
jgi:hypothetical protein